MPLKARAPLGRQLHAHVGSCDGQLTSNMYRLPSTQVVRQLNLLAEDVINADSDTTVSFSDDIESLSQVAFSLVSSNESSRKHAGVVLLQVLVEECSSQRFMQTFPNCGTKLLLVLKAAATDEVRRSTWAALRSLFVRISQMLELPGVRQEGAALAGKLAGALGPIIKRKQGDAESMTGSTAAVEIEAFEALAAALAAVPTAFRSHLKQLGQFAGEALCGEHSSAALRAAASHCLLLLPHVTGQAEQWSDAVQDVLATAHLQLDILYLGLEDPAAAKTYRATVKPDARGLQAGGEPAGTIQNAQMVVLARKRLAALLDCLERLLTQAAPTPVPVPGSAVVQLCARVLSVDSFLQAGRASPSAAAYMELLAVLPGMHAAAAKLLQLLLEVGGGALLPLHKSVTRLLADCLRRLAADPPLFLATSSWLVRREVYTCVAALMRTGGWGPVRDLAAPVMQCMLLELYSVAPGGAAQAPKASGGSKQAKKRKRAKAEDDLAGISSGSALLASAHGLKSLSPAVDMRNAAAQVAALTMVEELYKVGGAILGLEARAQLDATVAHQAATAAAGCERASRSGAAAPHSVQGVRLAAMRALLASVLAPCSHRPPFIAQALHFFRQGLTSADAELRAFCVGALLACEAFMHPRSQSPWPPARSAASATNGAATPSIDYLGVPRLWSAISPAIPTPGLQEDTMQQQQQQISQQDLKTSQHPTAMDTAVSVGAGAREADAKAQPLLASEPAQHAMVTEKNSIGVEVLSRKEPSTATGTAAGEEAGGTGKGAREQATAPAAEAQEMPTMVPAQQTLAVPASLPAVQQPSVVHKFPQAAHPAAKASIRVPQSVATAGQEDMSSDSEGSLPSIDTGSAGSQTSDSDEEMVS
ncbi:g9795 [Coccomyxa elongata]